MAETTIEWCHFTFNCWEGCQKVGPGCDHCYAEARDVRFTGGAHWGPHAPRRRTSPANWRKPIAWNKAAEGATERPRVFCASLADVMDNHASILPEWRRDLGKLIEATPNLDWMLLTKRIGNAAQYLADMFPDGVPSNVWLGATVVNQMEADRDIPKLVVTAGALDIAVTFLSVEPMLGPITVDRDLLALVDLVIVGGESGPHARPSNPQWFRDLRDQCVAADTAFFFKQNGEWVSVSEVAGPGDHFKFPDGRTVRRTGKKLAGRTLDGQTWDQMPARIF